MKFVNQQSLEILILIFYHQIIMNLMPVSIAFNSESLINGNAKESIFINQKESRINKK